MIEKLTVEQVILIQKKLIEKFGGLKGIRDKGLLESAIMSPYQTFDGELLNSFVEEQAAHLCYGLIKNHSFIDGNKRIGVMALLVTLKLNKIELKANNEELILLGLGIAEGRIGVSEIVQWINQRK